MIYFRARPSRIEISAELQAAKLEGEPGFDGPTETAGDDL